jgi:hypothetical protein
MSINIGRIVSLIFWIKIVPVRKFKKARFDKLNDNNDSTDSGDGWEWDLLSPRFLLLMAVLMGANAGYFYFALATMDPLDQMDAKSITTLLYKLINLVTAFIYPLILGRAACRYGSFSLPARLHVSKQALLFWLLPVPIQLLGIAFIHAQAVAECPLWVIPIAISSCLSGLVVIGMFILFFAWVTDFQQMAKSISDNHCDKIDITARATVAVMTRFEQLKIAVGELSFFAMLMVQVIQIFSLYNIFTGIDYNILRPEKYNLKF